MLDPSLDHNKSTSLLMEGVNNISKGVERDKEYNVEASCSRCCSRLLNEEKCWLIATSSSGDLRQIPLEDGPQTLAIGNWYRNTEK